MFPGLFHATPRGHLQPMPLRSRMLSIATVLLVFAIVATSVFGFAHVTAQQEALTTLREESQRLRSLQQAVVEADGRVMHIIAGDGAPGDYFDRLPVLVGGSAGALDQLGTIPVPGTAAPRPARQLLSGLTGTWTEAVSLVAAGDRDAAAALLVRRGTTGSVAALTGVVDRILAGADSSLRVHEERIRFGSLLVLVLQLSGGVLALLGLVFAFRSSVSEADGRAAAVLAADTAREQVARLFEMADVLQSAGDHLDVNAVLKAAAGELLPGLSGALYIFNNSRDRLVLSTSWARPEGEQLDETIGPASCWALKRGKPQLNRPDGSKLCCTHHSGPETVLEIPMIARGEIVGLLQLFASGAEAEARLERVANLGSALADGMSLALANMALREKLRNQALRDPLTGLYNRRYMEDSLQRFVRLAERENREISLLMIDLDHFKRLNDQHGHAFGDQVLRDSALALLAGLRETDIVCRFGGEELVVILPDCALERAADKAEMLRLAIQELGGTRGAEISASFGVACVPHTSQSVPDLLAAADAALYRAKQNGRNQVATAPLRGFRVDRPEPTPSAEISAFHRVAAE
ncbi:MAG: diguanylate cyclase [Devosia sp.]|nr:diguanylate cyclase [Devosia sp.]